MAVTEQSYTGNGSTTNYSFTFPYLKSTDIEVQVDATVQATSTWSLANATTVQFNSAPANGAKIKILRQTSVDNLTATFYAGSAIKSEDLNDNFTQNLYKTQEVGNRFFQNTGGTMTGDLTMAEDTSLIFEGATDDAYETTLAVADPTADRTVTIPNETGTIVTTGSSAVVTSAMITDATIVNADIASNAAIAGTKLADDSVTATQIAANAVTASELADNAVDTAAIAADAVTGAKIADDAINSEHYTDGSIDTAHIADSQITAAKLATDSVTAAKIAADAVGSSEIAANAVGASELADNAVDTAAIADDAVTQAKIADDAVGADQLADNSVGTSQIADAELTTLAGMQSGTASVLAGGTALAATLSEINTICDGKSVQTTISDTDSSYPTSGAVIDYVTAQIAPLGGLEVIADEDNFPSTQPAAGVVISISDAGGVVVNGSGVSTTARTAGNGSDNVTINSFPTSLQSTTLAAGIGLMVSSTGSSNTYTYHKILGKEDDIKQLSDDINDFKARYRVASSAPSSSLDEGDLWWDSTNNKLKVYNGSEFEVTTSVGNFYINTISSYSGTGGNSASFNGSAYRFTLSNPPTSAQQLLVSINGVIQKPNSGTGQPSEGFALNGNDIVLSSAPASGSDYFIITIGSAVSVGTPSNNTVTSAILQNGSVTTAKIVDANVTTAKIADDAVTSAKIADDAVVAAAIADDAVVQAAIADEAVDEARLQISNAGSNGQFLSKQSGNTGGLTWATVTSTPTDITVADESSDTTCFPLFVTAATGDLEPKTGSNLAFNSNTGALTATSFAGDGSALTGLASTVADGCIYENAQTISSTYTMGTNKNGMCAGPITVSGTVNIPSGSNWVIV